jgi:hypothetical protein
MGEGEPLGEPLVGDADIQLYVAAVRLTAAWLRAYTRAVVHGTTRAQRP